MRGALWPKVALLLPALALPFAAPASAHLVDTRTGASLEVRMASRPPGLEASFPRGGAYEKALQAVRAARYRQAANLFLAAEGEAVRAAESGDLSFPRSRTLGLKARLAADWARLLSADGKNELNQSLLGRSQAISLHNLYLSSLAYFGKPDDVLFDRAQRTYLHVIGSLESDPRAPLKQIYVAFAALLASGGQREKAADLMARLAVNADPQGELYAYLAAYHAAAGDAERAFRQLEAARDAAPSWAEERVMLRIANDFDNLRDDPRFSRLLGDDE